MPAKITKKGRSGDPEAMAPISTQTKQAQKSGQYTVQEPDDLGVYPSPRHPQTHLPGAPWGQAQNWDEGVQ